MLLAKQIVRSDQLAWMRQQLKKLGTEFGQQFSFPLDPRQEFRDFLPEQCRVAAILDHVFEEEAAVAADVEL